MHTLNATQSDPIHLGWMQGSPPSKDKLILHSVGDYSSFPKSRWSLSNIRQLMPTTQVPRGLGAMSMLARSLRNDLDAVTFQTLVSGQTMTWAEAFDANYTDGVVVMHRGKLIYEKYAGALSEMGSHMAYSVTKSFTGLLASMLIDAGLLQRTQLVTHYVPELGSDQSQGGFSLATVGQVMDMTTSLQYSENYADPAAEIWDHARAGGVLAKPSQYAGPASFYEFLQTVKVGAEYGGEHGHGFRYKTINTDVLGWIIRRITGQTLGQHLSQLLWQKLGCEQDAYLTVDTHGTEFAGGGLNTGLRDLARFGEMMRCMGSFNGQQIVPERVISKIQAGADKDHFASAGYALLPGWSDQSMWWLSHNPHGAYTARGIHGQLVYVDPVAEMTIARYASHPLAANAHLDPTSLPAYHALALHLLHSAH